MKKEEDEKRTKRKWIKTKGIKRNSGKYMAIVRYMNFTDDVVAILKEVKEKFCVRNYCGEVLIDTMPSGEKTVRLCDPKSASTICPIAKLRWKISTFKRQPL